MPEQFLAMGFALAGALSYAIASVIQQRTAAAMTTGRPLDPALVLRLLKSRRWLLGLVAVVLGYLLQAVALDLGRLLVVEPVFPLGLLLALVLAARADGRSLQRPEWVAAIATVGSLGVFLIAAEPSGGNRTAPATSLGATAAGAIVLAALCWAASLRTAGPRRSLVLSIGGGVGAGVTDALTKSVAALAGSLRFALFGDVRLYLLAVCGLITLTMQQNAYRAAGLAASLPAFVVLEPVAGSLLGLFVYHEGVGDGPLRIAIEALAVLTALWGIAGLANSVSTELARSAGLAAVSPAEPVA
ncbi:MAG TPA: DMT family transporter [Streptosporangiaceae bacterium]